MHENAKQSGAPGQRRHLRTWPGIAAVLSILLIFTLVTAGCAASSKNHSPASPEARDTSLRKIAADFATGGDLPRAQAALDGLSLANPAQLIISLAESDMQAGKTPAEVAPLARLADALGAHSAKLLAYIEPSPTVPPASPTPSPLPPSPTSAPSQIPTAEPPTALPPTATITPTAVPQKPRVVSDTGANVRSGPGKAYPITGKLAAGKEVEIVARNASGDWWQLALAGNPWVAGTVVRVLGPIDTVAMAKNIPPPPTAAPVPTAAPRPTAAPAAPTTAYIVASVRVRPRGQDSQTCQSGEHNIFVQVVDSAGNPLDGVRVREVWTNTIQVTGAQGKGSGQVEFDIYKDGGGQLEIVDEANSPKSPQTRGMSANLPDWDMFEAAGYCGCFSDAESCRAGWESRNFRGYPMNHYAYEVVFRRTY